MYCCHSECVSHTLYSCRNILTIHHQQILATWVLAEILKDTLVLLCFSLTIMIRAWCATASLLRMVDWVVEMAAWTGCSTLNVSSVHVHVENNVLIRRSLLSLLPLINKFYVFHATLTVKSLKTVSATQLCKTAVVPFWQERLWTAVAGRCYWRKVSYWICWRGNIVVCYFPLFTQSDFQKLYHC